MEPNEIENRILEILREKLKDHICDISSGFQGGLTLKTEKDPADFETRHISYGMIGRAIMISKTGKLVRICATKPLELFGHLYKEDIRLAHEEVEAFLRSNGFELEYNGEYERYYLRK